MSIREKINYLIEPHKENKLSHWYDCIMLVAIAIGIFPLMFRTQYRLFWYFDIVSGLCFTIDYIFRWLTCDLRSKSRNWISLLDFVRDLPFHANGHHRPAFNFAHSTFADAHL